MLVLVGDEAVGKTCSCCGQVKGLGAFYANAKGVCGRQAKCGECAERTYGVRRRARMYGLTGEALAAMRAEQGDICHLCRRGEPVPGRQLAVDHDHTTGAPRRLLCSACNRALGSFRDDPSLMRRAAEYVETYRGVA